MSLEKMIRIIPHSVNNAAMNLAIDRALFDIMQESLENNLQVTPTLRTYQFSGPTVIFGNQQSIVNRYKSGILKNVQVTKRDTGGGHMFFGANDINFSFIAPFDYYRNGNLISQYQEVNAHVVEALKKCGYNASLGRTSVRVDGRLLVGTARKHGKKVALHQGAILYKRYDDKIFKLLCARDDEIRRWKKLVTSLQNYNNQNFINLPSEIVASFNAHYKKSLTDEETSKANALYKKKYSNIDYIKDGSHEEDLCLIALEWTKDDDKK